MVMMRHPLSHTEYHRNEDRTVRVVGKDGVDGTFDRKGRWLSGVRRSADSALCQWVADGHLPPGMALQSPVIKKGTQGSAEPLTSAV